MSGDNSWCEHCGWPEAMHEEDKDPDSQRMNMVGECAYSFNDCPGFKRLQMITTKSL